MLVLRGSPAHSEFRLRKLEQRLVEVTAHDLRVCSRYVHFADLEQTLAAGERAVLDRLLRYGPCLPEQEPEGSLVLVIPRPGTISPWSSKATDIAHNCGLGKIRRLERGIAYYLQFMSLNKDEGLRVIAAAALHDPMTQVPLFRMEDAGRSFNRTEPSPHRAVDVLTGGHW